MSTGEGREWRAGGGTGVGDIGREELGGTGGGDIGREELGEQEEGLGEVI